MSIKIYQSGGFLTIEQTSGNLTNLPIGGYVALFIDDDNVQFSATVDKLAILIPAQVSLLEDETGAVIGDKTAVLAYLASMSAPGGGTLNEDLGFALFTDTVHNQANQQNIVAGTPQPLTLVSGAPLLVGGTAFQAIGANLWSNNKINPDNGNSDSYLIRLSFRIDPVSNNTSIILSLDIGTGALLSETSIALPASRNTIAPETVIMDVFAGANFFANGGTILLDGDDDYGIYDKVIKIEKTRKT